MGDTMLTSYTSGCHGRQAASLLVLILQHRHGAVAMVTSSREREGGRGKVRERETKEGMGGRKKQKEGGGGNDFEPDCAPKLIQHREQRVSRS